MKNQLKGRKGLKQFIQLSEELSEECLQIQVNINNSGLWLQK